MRDFLFILICSFLFIHCKNECDNENIKLGDLTFQQSTLDFFEYYKDKESVRFYSELGEPRTFIITQAEATNPILCSKVLCRPTYELEGQNGCEYFDADERHYILTSEDLEIHLKAGMSLETVETEDYFEFIHVELINADGDHSAGYVTNSTNIEPDFISTPLFDKSLDTLGFSKHTPLTDLLFFENNDFLVIYQKEFGLVKYNVNNKDWFLID